MKNSKNLKMRLMQRIRDSIKNDSFPDFVKKFVRNYYANSKNFSQIKQRDSLAEQNVTSSDYKENKFNIPQWVVNALEAVNVNVLEG